ncbi:MAG TPA: hypothetical protein VGM76_02755 [Lacipirellulaceae bacterium]|jgi:hypothetical protein
MKTLFYPCIVVASLVFPAPVRAADKPTAEAPPEVRSFELTPTAPPAPALKYRLLFDDAVDSRAGNAAILYLQAVLLMGADGQEKADQALKAYDEKDMARFNELADSLEKPEVFGELELASRCEDCNWETPFRERGVEALMPHLSALKNGIAKLIKVRVLRQIEQDKTADALATLRFGYELSEKIGRDREPCLVSVLVSMAVARTMDDCLVTLMNRPDVPNLYWALVDLPQFRSMWRPAMAGERRGTSKYVSPWTDGKQTTADTARAALNTAADIVWGPNDPRRVDPIRGTSAAVLEQARQSYADEHGIASDAAAKIDPAIVLLEYYVRQYLVTGDDIYAIPDLPYPELLSRSAEVTTRVMKQMAEQPANPFLQYFPAVLHAAWSFDRADRERTALAAVEALRSYAAANGGKLPARLEDVKDTPVPNNPVTSRPFEYRVDGDTATLSDSQSQPMLTTLTFTVKIRKP